jgi:transglutaminase-like putative cysteine protease
MSKAPSRRSAAAAAVVVTLSVAGVGLAQRAGRVLHRPIPGDVPLDELPNAMPSVPPSSSEAIARGAGAQSGWRGSQGVSQDIQRPRPTWDAPAREMDRQTRSAQGTRLQYQEVFTPSVQPFKRSTAHDMVDELGRLTVRDPSLRPITVGEDAPASWAGRRRARFVGEILVELTTSWPTPVPSIAGEQRVLRYATSDNESIEFLTDGAGNLFVRGLRSGTVRLTYVIEAPDFTFAVERAPALPMSEVAARVPEALRPVPPTWLEDRARRVFSQLNINRDARFDVLLAQLVGHFRGFRDAELAGQGPNLYVELATSGVGACRHRAYAMMLTMQALGIPARYVGNEAHAWVELFIPDVGWSRVDLGGWDVPLDARAPTERPRFDPGIRDRFPRPNQYQQQFSASATDSAGGASGGDGGAWIDPDAAVEPSADTSANGGASGASGAGSSGGASASGVGPSRGANVSGGSAVAERRGEDRASRAETVEPEDDAPKLATTTAIASVLADERAGFASGNGFARGSMVRIVGFVRDSDAVGINGLAVELHLVRNGRPVQGLGTAATAADGRFEAHVLLGASLEAGEYELRASTAGDARYAASVAIE